MPRFVLNCVKSRDTQDDWQMEDALEAGAIRRRALPAELDLRRGRPWWRVQHQGETGACIGFALADGVLRYQLVATGRLKPGDRLSPRFVWMAVKETDSYTAFPTTFIEEEGTELKQALKVVRKWGCALERDLPMQGGLARLGLKAFYARAARHRIASFHNLGHEPSVWRRWLAWQGPVLVGLNVDPAFERCARKGGAWLREFDARRVDGGHAVCLVGYGPEYFLLRNSWGTGWGEGGCARVSDAYARAAFEDVYGVVV
jgi:hypothetical protein